MTLWIIGKRCELPPPERLVCDHCGEPVSIERPSEIISPGRYVHDDWRWCCRGLPQQLDQPVRMAQVDGKLYATLPKVHQHV